MSENDKKNEKPNKLSAFFHREMSGAMMAAKGYIAPPEPSEQKPKTNETEKGKSHQTPDSEKTTTYGSCTL